MSAAKDLGTAWETKVARFLQGTAWPSAERRALRGSCDGGDISGLPGITIECKATKRHDLAGWLDEVEVERRNAGAQYGFVWVKRRGRAGAGDGYVLMDGWTLVRLLNEAGR